MTSAPIIIGLILFIPIILISGLIRIRRFGLKCLEEYQRTRLEIGKLAEEASLIRKHMEKISQ